MTALYLNKYFKQIREPRSFPAHLFLSNHLIYISSMVWPIKSTYFASTDYKVIYLVHSDYFPSSFEIHFFFPKNKFSFPFLIFFPSDHFPPPPTIVFCMINIHRNFLHRVLAGKDAFLRFYSVFNWSTGIYIINLSSPRKFKF